MGLFDKGKPPPKPTDPPAPTTTVTGTFVGTFTGTFTAAPAPSPGPSPSPSPSPSPPPAGGESADGTTIPPAAEIIDSLAARWTVVSGVVYRDAVATISANVTLLLYYDRDVYQQNQAGGWWMWSNGWQVSSDPRVPAPSPSPGVPNITTARHPHDYLQCGNANDGYWIDDNRWGAGQIHEGTASYEFMQEVERSLTVGPQGQIACRWRYNWPEYLENGLPVDGNTNEVKAYPSAVSGGRPGSYGDDIYPGWDYAVRLADGVVIPNAPAGMPHNIANDWRPTGGSIGQVKPAGKTPGTILPLRLPLSSDKMHCTGKWNKNNTCDGRGHLSFDIWLQGTPEQTHGHSSADITHEIMIPLGNWGNYGRHPNGRNPGWYDHDVTIDGVLYHVYCAKNSNGELHYNFGGLNGGWPNEETGGPRTGWKFIVFQHDGDNHPLRADGSFHINVPSLMAHLATCKDSRGVGFIQNKEYVASVELGIEMVWGKGDITLYDYKFGNNT